MKWNAELYNARHSFVYEFGAQVIELLDPQAGEIILDLGCGSGQLTGQIENSGATVIGIDSSAEMIETAKSNFPEIDFRVMDATKLDFDFQFDAVFSNAAFHWIKDPEKAVEAMYQNLKDGGRIVLEFGGKGNVQSIYKTVKELLSEKGYGFDDFWYFPTIGKFALLLEKTGFNIKFAQYFDRHTELSNQENAIIDWIEMFGANFFKNVSSPDRLQILKRRQRKFAPDTFQKRQVVCRL